MKRARNVAWKGHAKVSWSEKQPDGAGELKSPAEVATAIEKLTGALLSAGNNESQFSSHSIIIEITGDVSDLTIIDLPGM